MADLPIGTLSVVGDSRTVPPWPPLSEWPKKVWHRLLFLRLRCWMSRKVKRFENGLPLRDDPS